MANEFTFNDPTPDTKIWDLAQTPKRVTTDEGTVEERSMQEIIAAQKADAAANAANTPLHGLRVSQFRPAGPV